MFLWILACQPEPPPANPSPEPVVAPETEPDRDPFTFGSLAADVMLPEPIEEVTWHGTVRALTEVHCAGCHSEGGGAPFVIDGLSAAASSAWAAIEGTMPPAQFDPACRETLGGRWLDARGKAAFAAWAGAGFPEGDRATYVAPIPAGDDAVVLPPPDVVVEMDAPYLPQAEVDDETVWFVPTFTFTETTFITAARVQPGTPEQVHHVSVFVVDDAGDPVFGDTFADSPNNALTAWAPGNPPWALPDGAAFVVPGGSHLRFEVHYSVVSMPDGPVPDLTSVELWTRDSPPDDYAFMIPFNISPITIPAGDPEYVLEVSEPAAGLEGRLIGVTPHMHLRGAAIEMDVLPEAGGETCALRADDFDFEFQELHWYAEPLDITPTDGFRVQCTWDNSADNQPWVGDIQLPAVELHDGPNTLDEMCQVGWLMTRPYGP